MSFYWKKQLNRGRAYRIRRMRELLDRIEKSLHERGIPLGDCASLASVVGDFSQDIAEALGEHKQRLEVYNKKQGGVR